MKRGFRGTERVEHKTDLQRVS